MSQDQELIGLQNRLAHNLFSQEETQKVIAEHEQMLYNMEVELEEIVKRILELQGISSNIVENNVIYDDILKDVDLNLDENEEGETIH